MVVHLGINGEDLTLDISTLVTYSGQGKCKWVVFYYDTARKYGEDVRRWAQSISWTFTKEGIEFPEIFIERK